MELQIQKSLFDLDSFTEKLCGKAVQFDELADGATIDAILARVGNDTKKLVAVVNDGLKTEAQRTARANPAGWMEFNEDGEITATPFSGTPADMKAVNALVLTLAKTVFSYNDAKDSEQKKAAKDAAKEMVKTTPQIRDGLKKSAALTAEE